MDKLQLLNDHPLPFAKVLGLKFVAASETGVKAEMVVKPELCTRPDILHGGAVMAFADTLGAAATVLNLPEGKGTTTIESKTNFVGPAPPGVRRRMEGRHSFRRARSAPRASFRDTRTRSAAWPGRTRRPPGRYASA